MNPLEEKSLAVQEWSSDGMTEGNLDRRLPNRFIHYFFQAVEEQIGISSLHMMLRQAGLERFVGRLPGPDNRAEMLASDYAAFQKAIRLYYGKGARGTLTRIGRCIFQWMVGEAGLRDRLQLLSIRLRPLSARRQKILDFLARQMREPGGEISVHTWDLDLVVVVAGDATCGQSSSEPICWVTLGMIQEACLWATGEEPDVEESHCRARGDQTCTFHISWQKTDEYDRIHLTHS